MRAALPSSLRYFTILIQLLILSDVIDALTCNRYAGNTTLPSNTCTGSVCLSRRDSSSSPLYYDCGEGAYYSHYADGCYGVSSLLCVCRTSNCNTANYVSQTVANANSSLLMCNGTSPNTASSIGVCSGYFCLSYSATPSNMYYCLSDPPSMLAFAPFLGLCYRYEYGRNGVTTKSSGSICVCDTDYCSDGISALPTAPESVISSNGTTVSGTECFTDENRTVTCRGDVCFLYRNTLTGLIERGCLLSQRTAEARRLLVPSYTRDVFMDYYICNSAQCNRNIASANASIVSVITTTASPSDTTGGSTDDVWWTTPKGYTSKPNDTYYWNDTYTNGNSTWWNDTKYNGSDYYNYTNQSATTTAKPKSFSQEYTFTVSFLLLLISSLIIA